MGAPLVFGLTAKYTNGREIASSFAKATADRPRVVDFQTTEHTENTEAWLMWMDAPRVGGLNLEGAKDAKF